MNSTKFSTGEFGHSLAVQFEIDRNLGHHFDRRTVQDVRPKSPLAYRVSGCSLQQRVTRDNAQILDAASAADHGLKHHLAFNPGPLCQQGILWLHTADDAAFIESRLHDGCAWPFWH